VREQTQELASWALGDSPSSRGRAANSGQVPFSYASDSEAESRNRRGSMLSESDRDARTSIDSARPNVIAEVSEPLSPGPVDDLAGSSTNLPAARSSALTDLIRGKAQKAADYLTLRSRGSQSDLDHPSTPSIFVDDTDATDVNETSALLPRERLPVQHAGHLYKNVNYAEQQWIPSKSPWQRFRQTTSITFYRATHPEHWDLRLLFSNAVGAVSAVLLGLLLNILDALSYGMLLLLSCNWTIVLMN
jgi:hypothetical protein